MSVSLEVLYDILTKWAGDRTAKTYSELSNEYHTETTMWLEPHGSWDKPLGELANILSNAGMPALTALVVLKGKNEPGADFWGCAPNVPNKPTDEMVKIEEWLRMTNECYSHIWSPNLPLSEVRRTNK